MLIKAGVDISMLSRNARRAMEICNNYLMNNCEEMILTSTFEGNHIAGSLHYANDAFDFRFPKCFSVVFMDELRGLLGIDCDVVKYKRHIHVEYDPKE
ncbi:MAG: hypothetical protein E3J94_02805 [Desulfobacteraceae bacterium]|nr:MAG: hypothetical protein E3J94_02805 [Desulfobacteraceae bacterium]